MTIKQGFMSLGISYKCPITGRINFYTFETWIPRRFVEVAMKRNATLHPLEIIAIATQRHEDLQALKSARRLRSRQKISLMWEYFDAFGEDWREKVIPSDAWILRA